MGSLLAPDDLSANDLVTVHSRASARRVPPELAHLVSMNAGSGGVPRGVPLRVIGVSLPFVACAVIHPGGGEHGPTILDVRRVRLACVDPSYVEAITAFRPAEEDDDACPGDQEADTDTPRVRHSPGRS